MNKFRFTIKIMAIAIFTFAFASMAQAQATRTWVSGVGDDVNPCSRTAPCKTFAGAISKTAVNGEIDCLDPGGFGAVTITKSITIDGSPTGVGSILNAATNGIIINITAADTFKSVTIRGISIQGAGSGLNGISIVAGNLAGLKVFVENCFISGQNGSPGRGIQDFRANGGLLSVNNTTVTNCAGAGIVVDPTSGGGSGLVTVAISNTRVQGSVFGMNFGSNVKAVIYNSVITGITNSGVFLAASAGLTEVAVDHCVINGNGTGVTASSANTIVRVSNTTLLNNTTLFTATGGGQVLSYGNNQASGLVLGVPVSPS
ncbi:MAG: hypothetical protein M3R69_17745 [Acidobacteriota bacterium]|nr:hypothetical protein [Acidobacteriota bacterium]